MGLSLSALSLHRGGGWWLRKWCLVGFGRELWGGFVNCLVLVSMGFGVLDLRFVYTIHTQLNSIESYVQLLREDCDHKLVISIIINNHFMLTNLRQQMHLVVVESHSYIPNQSSQHLQNKWFFTKKTLILNFFSFYFADIIHFKLTNPILYSKRNSHFILFSSTTNFYFYFLIFWKIKTRTPT